MTGHLTLTKQRQTRMLRDSGRQIAAFGQELRPQMPLVLSVACMRPSQCSCAEQLIPLVQLQSPEGSSQPYEEVAVSSDVERASNNKLPGR